MELTADLWRERSLPCSEADISFVDGLDEDRLIKTVCDMNEARGRANSVESGGTVEPIQRQMFLTNDKMQFDRDNCKAMFSSEFSVGDAWLDSCLHVKDLGISDVCNLSCPSRVTQRLRMSTNY